MKALSAEQLSQCVAIIGMAGRFPGADSVPVFWRNIVSGKCSLETLNDDDLRAAGVPDEMLNDPRCIKRAGVLHNTDLFDASFFGYSPREAELIDPQQRLFLECAWEAFEDAGYTPESVPGIVGVFAGAGMNYYFIKNILSQQKRFEDIVDVLTFIGNDKDYLCSRVAYKLGCTGPCFVVNSACSTSLVAVQVGYQSLLTGQCDLALCGGVALQSPRARAYLYNEGEIFSRDGCCRTFDKDAGGMVFGEGLGLVLLKRAEEAIRDCDHVYAIIRSIVVNNDGSAKAGYTAPGIDGQTGLIALAQDLAGVHPDELSFVEAHGTGTKLGDAIEVSALTKAFRRRTERKRFCALGSVKTNIGHLDAASGVTGLIKTSLALEKRTLPPSLNFTEENPELGLQNSPFFVAKERIDWTGTDIPLVAGISSFGMGGTNAHAIVQEPPPRPRSANERTYHLVPVSARSAPAIDHARIRLMQFLEENTEVSLQDTAYTLQVGRRAFPHRWYAVCADTGGLIAALSGGGTVLSGQSVAGFAPSVVFAFSGQGAQYPGMAYGLYKNESVMREFLDEARRIMKSETSQDLFDILFPVGNITQEDAARALTQTEYTQPALFAVEYALARLFIAYGITPAACIGHSIGEYSAAALAGVFSFEQGMKIVLRRAKIMSAMQPGSMAYVALAENELQPLICGSLVIALVNAPALCVVAGPADEVAAFTETMKQKKVRCGLLHTSHAFHSPMMDEAARQFKDFLDTIPLNRPSLPIISNVSGTWITGDQCSSSNYWADHLRNTVRFSAGVSELLNRDHRLFLEVGPGNTLSTLIGMHRTTSRAATSIPSLRNPDRPIDDQAFFLGAIGGLWAAGMPFDWTRFYPDPAAVPNRIPLPTYPFERKRFWIEFAGRDHVPSAPGVAETVSHSSNVNIAAADQPRSPGEPAFDITSRESLTAIVAEAWDAVLRIGKCDPDESFLSLGGNSLMLSQVVARLNERLPFELPVAFLMGSYTINEQVKRLFEYVSSAPVSDALSAALELSPAGKESLSPAQQRLWYLCQLDLRSPAFNLTHTFRIHGQLDAGRLEEAVRIVVRRHAPLRSVFYQTNGIPAVRVMEHADVLLSVSDCSGVPVDESETIAATLIHKKSSEPFDLERGPLFRCGLYRISPEEHLFVFFVHHIVSDGWSMTILLKELSVLYAASADQRDSVLQELKINYFDYTAYMNRRDELPDHPGDTAFWKDYFSGGLPVLALPTDFPRPKAMKFTGGLVKFTLSQELSRKITAYAASRNVTPFSILLSLYGLLLYRYTHQEQMVIGCPSANRDRVEFEPLIGLFLNMLPIRLDFNADATVEKLIEATYEDTLRIFSHQNLQFGRLVELLQPERHLNISPVFQTMFAYNNYLFGSGASSDIVFEPGVTDRGASEYDLSLYMWSSGDEMHGVFEYSNELFLASSVHALCSHFQTMCAAAMNTPSTPAVKLPVFSDPEIIELTTRKFSTSCTIPQDTTVHALLDPSILSNGETIAITDGERSISYTELANQSNQVCNALRSAGAEPGALVGVHMSRSIDILPVMLGILKAGAAYIPLDPLFPVDRIDYMVHDARLRFIISDPESGRRFLGDPGIRVLTYDNQSGDFTGESTVLHGYFGTAESHAYILYTSGSTGAPKGVEIPHKAVVNFLLSMKKNPGIDKYDKLLAVTTISFDIAGLELFLPLLVGATIVMVDGSTASDGFELKKRLENSGATIMQATPATWRMLLDAGWKKGSGLKILCGGEAMSRELADRLLATGAELWNMYGPTETTIWSSVSRIIPGMREPDLGAPIDNTQFFFLDDALQEVPRGVIAELCIGGTGLATGYHRKPELTERRFVTINFGGKLIRVYRTGDLVRTCPDGIIDFFGRVDRQVKIRGYRIELEEIETVLTRYPEVAQAVVSTYSTPSGRELVAYVRSGTGHAPDTASIRKHLGTYLPHYMVPASIVEIKEFPLTPNGKIDRLKLTAPQQEARADLTEKTARAPRDDVDIQLIRLWEQILGRKEISIEDDYFDLGGNSLSATRLFASIRKVFGVELPLAILYGSSTVAALADVIRSNRTTPSWNSLVPIQPQGDKAPLFLIHGGGGNVLLYRSLSRNMGHSHPVYGLQARGLNNPSELRHSVEEMASCYIEEIKNKQPSGPYHLGGYCMGGLIAYEMACRLEAMGDEVGLVALMSTSARWVEMSALGRFRYTIDNILFHLKNLKEADTRGKGRFLAERSTEAVRRIQRKIDVLFSSLMYAVKIRKKQPVVTMERVNDNAAFHYIPKAFGGTVTLFKPKGAEKYSINDAWGWDKVPTGKLMIVNLQGYLNGILVEPYVKELADKIRIILDGGAIESDFKP